MEITFLLAHGILALAAGALFLSRRRFALVVIPSGAVSLLAGLWIMGHTYHLSTATGIAHFLDDIVGASLLAGWLGLNMVPLLLGFLWVRSRTGSPDRKGAIVAFASVTLVVLLALLPVNAGLVLLFSLE